MKSIGSPKTFRRLHSDAGASDRLESWSINSSLDLAARGLSGLMNGMLFSRSVDFHVDNVVRGNAVVGCQSSVGHEILCTDMLLKA